jgi:c-di-GMP-binding flagellar brake protein YcgR
MVTGEEPTVAVSTESERAPERKFMRVSVNFPVSVILSGEELVLPGQALDLGAGGMRVAIATDLPRGQNLVLRFTLPNDPREFVVRARVVLSFFDAASGRYAHGVAFTQYASTDREAIDAYVSSVIRTLG